MAISPAKTAAAELFLYSIASTDMFFCEMEQRDVFIAEDDAGRILIWAETCGQTESNKIELCGIFLEYALYCATSYPPGEAAYNMSLFGTRLGELLAAHLRRDPRTRTDPSPALHALECVFTSMHAGYFEDQGAAGVRFVVTRSPLEQQAKQSGLSDVELARLGMNAMCESLCHGMDPGLAIAVMPATRPEFMFTLSMPVAA